METVVVGGRAQQPFHVQWDVSFSSAFKWFAKNTKRSVRQDVDLWYVCHRGERDYVRLLFKHVSCTPCVGGIICCSQIC